MLTLTKKTDYALIALTHLARQPERRASAREIGDHYGVPLGLLMNVLKTLTRGGLIRSIRGARGGYALAVDPADITLAELIETIEGPIGLVQCAVEGTENAKGDCDLQDLCPVRKPAIRVHELLKSFLNKVTLLEIADDTVPPTQPASTSEELVHEDAHLS